jgi:hypothetical protein
MDVQPMTPDKTTAMHSDLDSISREELLAEVRKLRQGIRVHRDSAGHKLCWHHPLTKMMPNGGFTPWLCI